MSRLRILFFIVWLGLLAFGPQSGLSISAQVRSKGIDPEWANKLRDAPSQGIYSHGLPRQLFLTIYGMVSSGNYAGTVFAPNGGWIVLPQAHIGGYGSGGLPPAAAAGLNSLPARNPTQAAIGSNGGWLYVWGTNEKEFKSENLPQDMLTKLWELYNENRGKFRNQNALHQVAFTPNGGWLIIYTHVSVTKACPLCMEKEKWERKAAYNNLPSEIDSRLGGMLARGEEVFRIAFAPSGGWVILSGRNGYTYNGIPDDAASALTEVREKGMSIRDMAFGPRGGWVLIASRS